MSQKDCKIIQDLLPNYVEGLTNDETNNFVLTHLNNCEECNSLCENLKKDFFDKEITEKKDVNFLKKHKKNIRILQIVIFLILILFIIIIGRKLFIIKSIQNKAISQNFNNYHILYKEFTNSGITEMDTYFKDGNFVTIQTNINNEKIIQYKFTDDKYFIIEKNGVSESLSSEPTPYKHYNVINKDFFSNLFLALTPNSIAEVEFSGKKCYLVKVGNSYLNIIDKSTGLTLKEINLSSNVTVEYNYSFGTVEDSDILAKKPNT